ncbi:MAG: hypothetical protein ACXVDD_15535 [Polyangia bacterium]
MVVLCGAPAAGETIDATATTLLSGHADPRDGKIYTVVPAYQSLSLLAADLKIPLLQDAKVVMRAWGEVAFADPIEATGDVDALYLQGKFYKRHFEFRLGRQLIVGGAARITQMDGLQLTGYAPAGFGLTAYGGVPVTPRFGVHRGDAMVGARAFWRRSMSTELGLSIIDVVDRGLANRQDVGFDGRLAVNRELFFDAYALYSLIEFRFAEAQIAGTWAPLPQLEGSLDAHHTAPDLFLPRSSIFAVFSNETHDEFGGRLWARPLRWMRLAGDYHYISGSAGSGNRGGGKVTFIPSGYTTLGLELRGLTQQWTGGYFQSRVFGVQRITPVLTATLDADFYVLERPINGQDTSFTAAGTVGWDFSPGWRLVLSALADRTPLVDWRFEAMAKLVFNHTWRIRRVQ